MFRLEDGDGRFGFLAVELSKHSPGTFLVVEVLRELGCIFCLLVVDGCVDVMGELVYACFGGWAVCVSELVASLQCGQFVRIVNIFILINQVYKSIYQVIKYQALNQNISSIHLMKSTYRLNIWIYRTYRNTDT